MRSGERRQGKNSKQKTKKKKNKKTQKIKKVYFSKDVATEVPIWQPDEDAPSCPLCTKSFTFLFRKVSLT
jgi:hypothetical protein